MSLRNIVKAARVGPIRPALSAYLSKHQGLNVTRQDVVEHTVAALTSIGDDRSGHLHPSQLYRCPRRQVLEYIGAPAMRQYTPSLFMIFTDGHFRHLRWQALLLEAGILDEVEVPVSIPALRLRGSMDGKGTDFGFELKGTRRIPSEPTEPHVRQMHAYMLASGLRRFIIVYEDKGSQEYADFEVPADDEILHETERILLELNRWLDRGELPPVLEPCSRQTGEEWRGCPYAHLCLSVNTPEEAVTWQ